MIRLHHVPGSRSFRVLWLLEELGEAAELRLWSLTDGSLRSPEFRALSPAGRIPALEVDGQVVFESGAIVQYLTETRGRLAPKPGEAERAQFLEWVSFAETQASILQNLNIHHIYLRPESARSAALTKLDTKRLEVTVRALEGYLQGREWLLSDFSAADCMMGFNVEAMFRFVRPDAYPALAAYCARAMARPAYQRAAAKSGSSAIYTQDFYELPNA
ncbi:glutathione S-transferase family protein [Sedimentimonas flavescens]|uniref:glutathione S-transferase family protein n=1 Tax=Sedimentimonas flavescens TaxID=2851012 RepID=UPI0021A72F4B|nr:glutathione S-transferase family protein [Sedimentimonas flavescens]MCT2540797.1 glutathione S-transferase family protein [Sedimentimonas flavescens]